MVRGIIPGFVVLASMLLCPQTRGDYAFSDLVDAAKRGDYHAAHKLLTDGSAVEATDEQGYTALHWAGIRGHWRIFRELLEAGAPVDINPR